MNDLDFETANKLFSYEEETGKLIRKIDIKHAKFKAGDEAGRVHTDSSGKKYRRVGINGKEYRTHRIIYLLKTGKVPEHEIDHKDGNGLNNLWKNLRDVTSLENMRNLKKYRNNTSGVVGVYWDRATGKWKAQIRVKGKDIYLGLFTHKEDAIGARKEAEIKYGFHSNHGDERPL
jgi:hypothetical protein